MITLSPRTSAPPTIQCDRCHEPVHIEDVILLQCEGHEPDTVEAYHVHSHCLEHFLTNQAGRWCRLPKSAIDAGWR